MKLLEHPRTSQLIPTLYILGIGAMELTILANMVVLGVVWAGCLIALLLVHSIVAAHAPYRRLLPPLALLPLTRLVSLVLPLSAIPQLYWYVIVGAPLFLALDRAVHLLSFAMPSVRRPFHTVAVQALISLSGVPLGAVAFTVAHPAPLVDASWTALAVAMVTLTIFNALLEELIFRGLIQWAASSSFASKGYLCSSVCFVVAYLGSGSWSYILLIAIVGLWLGWCVATTGSLVGVIAAHSLFSITLMVVLPLFPQLLVNPIAWSLWLVAVVVSAVGTWWVVHTRRVAVTDESQHQSHGIEAP